MIDMDFGSSGSGVSAYLSWHARESNDGAIPSRTFSIREGGVRSKLDTDTFVIDVASLKTGWMLSQEGGAPQKKWNADIRRFEPSPGQDWKRAFSVRVAITAETAVRWEQDQVGAFRGMQSIVAAINSAGETPAGKMPVVKFTGPTKIDGKITTFSPDFVFVKWADKPACLAEAAPSSSNYAPVIANIPAGAEF